MLKLLIKYLKPYWRLSVLAVLLLSAQAVSDLYMPNLMADIVNNGIFTGDIGYILRRGIVMLVVALFIVTFAVTANYIAARLGTMFSRDLRYAVFCRVEDFSLHEFNKFGAASLITRTTNDITQIQNVVILGFRFVLFAPIMCGGGLIMAYTMNKSLLWVLAVAVSVLVVIMITLTKIALPMFTSLQKKIDSLNLVLRESLIGVRVIRAFNKMEYDGAKFEERNSDMTALAIRINRIMAFMQPLMMLVMSFTSLSITWFGGGLISQGSMQLGDMMAFTQYAMTILFSILMMVMMFVMIPRAQVSAVRILEVLSVVPEIKDPEDSAFAQKATDTAFQIETPPAGLVEFRGVEFAYEGAEAPVLSDISFTARPGEVTAIIGGTGSGKSTLINLIPRFYDVTSGEVYVGGRDVRQITQAELRSRIGFVAQGDMLFSGTVADNIRFGKKDATDEEVAAAAKIAQAYDFITQKIGFDGEVSASGTNLSGGQKQRLAIARAIARKPAVYIFDDSFSALDYKTDVRLRTALKSELAVESPPPTVIIVAQRISTVLDADKILVLDGGHLVGIGTHSELLENCEVYREIVESQLGKGETA